MKKIYYDLSFILLNHYHAPMYVADKLMKKIIEEVKKEYLNAKIEYSLIYKNMQRTNDIYTNIIEVIIK